MNLKTTDMTAVLPNTTDMAARWNEALLVYRLYAALATQFNFAPLPYPEGELPPGDPAQDQLEKVFGWFDEIDEKVRAYQIRQLPPEILNANDASLCAFIQRHLRKPDKTPVDRDKIDLLLVQYFALCAPEDLYRKEIKLENVALVLQPVIAEADPTPLEWCEPLDEILQKVDNFRSLRDLMEDGILEQGRLLKEAAGCMFYDPAALVAFCRFNFLLRRAFIRLLHADLNAVRIAVNTLEQRGVRSVDCRRAGFSAAEPTSQIRYFCENWQQPFKKDYTENSVNKSFEQLLALRTDLEEAIADAATVKASSDAISENTAIETPEKSIEQEQRIFASAAWQPDIAEETVETELPTRETEKLPEVTVPAPKATHANQAPAIDLADAEECLDSIWEQLIAAPPSRGRSMSTVILRDTKVLLSSWEVAAFVSQDGQVSEDLRRAVVARAMLAVAMDQRKRSGEETGLASGLGHARSEVSYFQGRVEQAKLAKNTEAAVNLGISTKRLLSLIEEAEKLQP